MLGVFMLFEIKATGAYLSENLVHDMFKAMLCAFFPMIYPIVKYFKRN